LVLIYRGRGYAGKFFVTTIVDGQVDMTGSYQIFGSMRAA
jgi:hypothetical protein